MQTDVYGSFHDIACIYTYTFFVIYYLIFERCSLFHRPSYESPPGVRNIHESTCDSTQIIIYFGCFTFVAILYRLLQAAHAMVSAMLPRSWARSRRAYGIHNDTMTPSFLIFKSAHLDIIPSSLQQASSKVIMYTISRRHYPAHTCLSFQVVP